MVMKTWVVEAMVGGKLHIAQTRFHLNLSVLEGVYRTQFYQVNVISDFSDSEFILYSPGVTGSVEINLNPIKTTFEFPESCVCLIICNDNYC